MISLSSGLVSLGATLALAGCDLLDGWTVTAEMTMYAERFDVGAGEFSPLHAPEHERIFFNLEPTDGGYLAIGGLNEEGLWVGIVEHYDATADLWTDRASLPEPGPSWILTLGDRVCSLGGYEGYDVDVEREVWCYDTAADQWTRGPDLPRDYTTFWPVIHDSRVWLVGGTARDGGTIIAPVGEVWSWDGTSGAWIRHDDMPAPRGLAAVHSVGGRIAVVGGYDVADVTDVDETPEEREMLLLDTATETWTTTPQMPHARFLFGTDVVDDELVVFFGVTTGPLVEIWNPTTQTWRGASEVPDGLDAGVYSYVAHQGLLYFLVLMDGASGGSSTSSGNLWAFDPATDTWEIAGVRDPSRSDALFSGIPHGDDLDWVGTFTELDFQYTPPEERSAPWASPRSPLRAGHSQVVMSRPAVAPAPAQ